MRTSDFDYHLPQSLIAQSPVEPRDSSRLLVLHRATGRIEHRPFVDLPELLAPGDVLVFNDTRVIPARLVGRREDTGGRVEFLLLERLEPGFWRALGKPGRSLVPGRRVVMDRGLEVEVVEAAGDGAWNVRLSFEDNIGAAGEMPLPPYIHAPLEDPNRYQTVYARKPGSVAAPTAGLHFTPALLDDLRAKGVRLAFVTLHVGLDTFRPVRVDDPLGHKLHGERYELGQEAAAIINDARREGRRVVAVGTTSVRLLEQAALLAEDAGCHELRAASGRADLYILPGHRFRMVDAMVTNFHLPRTTLLMMVCAFAGRDAVLAAYLEAIELGYRFYSFGDGMMVM